MIRLMTSCFSAAGVAILLSCATPIFAECPCQRSGGSGFVGAGMAPVPYFASGHSGGYAPAMAVPQWGAHPMYNPQPVFGGAGSLYGNWSMPMTQGQVNPAAPSPPPGTLGRTFQLPSRPVPVEKHPRVGMIDVKVNDADEVIVHDMNAMRTEATISGFRDAEDANVWHFESKPLYPGLDHIYRVQATFKNPDGTKTKSERYVRLIMGRVVELVF